MVDEKLQTVRHSCAHVMAEAVLNLFPGTKIAIGPSIDNGFYYDFDFPQDTKFTENDFPKVEKEMRKILSGNHEFIRKEVSKEEALKQTNIKTDRLSEKSKTTLSQYDRLRSIQNKAERKVV